MGEQQSMNEVSFLTLNDETREIVDAQGREKIALLQTEIALLQAQIEYMAQESNIDISGITIEEN